MRLQESTDGRKHPDDNTPNDHHSQPVSVSINNTTQSLPPGTTYDLDVDLGRDDLQVAIALLMGPDNSGGMFGTAWNEFAQIVATRDSGEAMGESVRSAGTFKKIYSVTYSKQNSDSYLSHKIFDNVSSQRYIAVQDAVITGSNLRITFKNFFGGSTFLWVKGQVLAW